MAAIGFLVPPSPREESYFEGSNVALALEPIPTENYFLSRGEMRRWLDKYTEVEVDRILDDLEKVGPLKFKEVDEAREMLLAAAGPMGGASTVMERLLRESSCYELSLRHNRQWIYIDPLRECMPTNMQHTYIQDLAENVPQKEACERWLEAARFLSQIYLALSLARGYAIADGTMMGVPYAKKALDIIVNRYHYKTTLVHVSCDETIRRQSWEGRKVSRWSEEEFHSKNEEFYALLGYFAVSMSKILFYYRDEKNQTTLAATFVKRELVVHNEAALVQIQKLHASDLWESVIGPLR